MMFRRLLATGVLGVVAMGMVLVVTPVLASAAWTPDASKNVGTEENFLHGVSCVSPPSPPKFCVAVGEYLNGSARRTLTEKWNGFSWKILPSPNEGTGDNRLKGVSCVSKNFCQAVGEYFNTTKGAFQNLAEKWNGRSWKIELTPDPGGSNDFIDGVSCVTTTFCKAAGQGFNTAGEAYETMILGWSESWGPTNPCCEPSPNGTRAQRGDNFLSAVSCPPLAPPCTTVGEYFVGIYQTLIESGPPWTKESSPNQGTESSLLKGVSCVTTTFCVAVGNYKTHKQTLIESGPTPSWKIETSPNKGSASRLQGVSCVSSTSCEAVGSYISGIHQTLIETGPAPWMIDTSPNQGTKSNDLEGVSCVPAPLSCKAVGFYLDGTLVPRTLIESGP
jgi:hypothetical protein